MHAVSQEEYETLLRKRSIILSRPANDPKRAPKFFRLYDFSVQGIERMLDERLNKTDGSLAFYREEVRRALKAWDTYSSRQPRKLAEPVGIWQEAINKGRAHVRTIEAECRTLNKLLDEAKAKEVQETKAIHRKPLGIMKMKAGTLFPVDGREVKTNAEGLLLFEDDGSDVLQYLDKLGQAKRAATVAKRKEDRERQERVRAARRQLKT